MTTKKISGRAVAAASAAWSDPVYVAIAQHHKLIAESDRLYDELQKPKKVAEKKHGRRPWPLEDRRNYSVMGGAEITGIAPLRQLYERTRRVEKTAAVCMAKTKPTTLVGAAALLDYVRRNIEIGPNWHTVALGTTAAALNRMSSRGV